MLDMQARARAGRGRQEGRRPAWRGGCEDNAKGGGELHIKNNIMLYQYVIKCDMPCRCRCVGVSVGEFNRRPAGWGDMVL